VSEFAEELLILQKYFSHDPDYWVSSGLVDSTESRDALFAATQSACDPRTGLSSQAAAARLFDAHFVRALLFLISVVTFPIHSHLTSGMRKFSKTCKTSAIAILIRVKVGLEFTVLFSLSRYIFLSVFPFFSCIYYFYLYIYISAVMIFRFM